jgi:hypothetical protein
MVRPVGAVSRAGLTGVGRTQPMQRLAMVGRIAIRGAGLATGHPKVTRSCRAISDLSGVQSTGRCIRIGGMRVSA